MAALHVCATPISERGQYTTLLDSTKVATSLEMVYEMATSRPIPI